MPPQQKILNAATKTWSSEKKKKKRIKSRVVGFTGGLQLVLWRTLGGVGPLQEWVGSKVFQALRLCSPSFCFKYMVVEVGAHGSIYLNHKPTRLDGGREFQLVTFQKSVGCDSSLAAGLAASSLLGVFETCLLPSAGGGFPVVGGWVMVLKTCVSESLEPADVTLHGILQMCM